VSARNYDFVLAVDNAAGFVSGRTCFGITSETVGLIANVNYAANTIKVRVNNAQQEFSVGESLRSNTAVTTGGSANTNVEPYVAPYLSSDTTTATATISSINISKFIREKNAFEQKPIVRLYSIYYPGEWYPANANGNPTMEGAGYPWPHGIPFRIAEVRGDIISDIQYAVKFANVSYIPYPIDSGNIGLDSSGKINDLTLTLSNWDNLIGNFVENPYLVGLSSNACIAIVNSELVTNIDPRTVQGNVHYDSSVVDARGSNAVLDYEATQALNGTWTPLKQDSRDLLGAVVEIKTTYANFLDYWPEYSRVTGAYANTVQVITTLPYRPGDNVRSNTNSTEYTIVSVGEDYITVSSTTTALVPGEALYIVNPEADAESFVLDTFKINNLDGLDDKAAKFTLTSWLQYFKLQLPKRRFLKNTCPWSYKGEECQYPTSGTGTIPGSTLTANGFFDINNATVFTQAEDECARNQQACELRRNTVHFGAFPGTGATLPR